MTEFEKSRKHQSMTARASGCSGFDAHICKRLPALKNFDPTIVKKAVYAFSSTEERERLGWPAVDEIPDFDKSAKTAHRQPSKSICATKRAPLIADSNSFFSTWIEMESDEKTNTARALYVFQWMCLHDVSVRIDLAAIPACCLNYLAKIALNGVNAMIINQIIDQIFVNRRHARVSKALKGAEWYDYGWLDNEYYDMCGNFKEPENFPRRQSIVVNICRRLGLKEPLAIFYKRYLRWLSTDCALRPSDRTLNKQLHETWKKTRLRLATAIKRSVPRCDCDAYLSLPQELREAFVMAGECPTGDNARLKGLTTKDGAGCVLHAIVVDNVRAVEYLSYHLYGRDFATCIQYHAQKCKMFMMSHISFLSATVVDLLFGDFSPDDLSCVSRLKTNWKKVIDSAQERIIDNERESKYAPRRLSAAGAAILITKYPAYHLYLETYADMRLFSHVPPGLLYRNTSNAKLVLSLIPSSLIKFMILVSNIRGLIPLLECLSKITIMYLWNYPWCDSDNDANGGATSDSAGNAGNDADS
jgi:hypothetical protein